MRKDTVIEADDTRGCNFC